MAEATGSSSIVIEELGGQKRRLELRGPGLPHQGAAWKTELRMNTEWYPGNPQEATQQVLGPAEMPSTWEGFWRLTMLNRCPCLFSTGGGSPTEIVQPVTLRDICDSMFYLGGRLRVTWVASTRYVDARTSNVTTGQHNIVREGRCKSWEFPHDRVEDIGWHFEFEWMSRGAAVQKVIATRDDAFASALAKFSAAGENALRAIKDAKIKTYKQSIKNSASKLTLGQLEALANAPQAILDSFGRAVQTQLSNLERVTKIANTVRGMPYALANSAVNIARNVVTTCNQVYDSLTRTPPEKNTLTSNVADLTRNASYLGKSLNTQKILANEAKALETSQQLAQSHVEERGAKAQARTRAGTNQRTILGVHVVHEGDTPQSISMQWYSSPDYVMNILRANKIPVMRVKLRAGQSLVIPALTTSTGQ